MSDPIQRLEQKIDEQSSSINGKMDKLIETMTTFVAFQARAEERHSTSNKRLEKLEIKMEKVWDMVHRNALFLNGAVAIVTAIVIWVIKGFIDG